MTLDRIAIFRRYDNPIGSVLVVDIPSFLDGVFEVNGCRLSHGSIGGVRASDEAKDFQEMTRGCLGGFQSTFGFTVKEKEKKRGINERHEYEHHSMESLSCSHIQIMIINEADFSYKDLPVRRVSP
jgi:hypothetical protein